MRRRAREPPASPATCTSAHAVPSGYGSFPCSRLIRNARSGIMNSTPRSPPKSATIVISTSEIATVGSVRCQMKSAGIVKITPAASDSPAEPIVWTMFVSSTVPRPVSRKTATAMTAAGIEALTVRPTRRPRYALAAPNRMATMIPKMIALGVNSATGLSLGTYGGY